MHFSLLMFFLIVCVCVCAYEGRKLKISILLPNEFYLRKIVV